MWSNRLLALSRWLRHLFGGSTRMPWLLPPWAASIPCGTRPFAGKERELQELNRLCLPSPRTRLITVVDLSRIGKTRLLSYWASLVGDRVLIVYVDLNWIISREQIEGVVTRLRETALGEEHLVLMLDNAVSAEQVMSLLLGRGNDVIVTSRVPVPGLAKASIELGPLEPAEAAKLVGWGVRRVLNRTCQRVEPDAAKVFRLLRAFTYPLPTATVAALANLAPGTADHALAMLANAGLVERDRGGRVYLADLHRAYTATGVGQEAPEAARDRLLRWWIASAVAAVNALAPGWAGSGLLPTSPRIRPQPFEPDRPALALGWRQQELPTAHVMIRHVAQSAPGAWTLAVAFLRGLFLLRPRTDSLRLLELGLDNAQLTGDPVGIARCEHALGWLEDVMGFHEAARLLLERTLRCHGRIDDPQGLVWTKHMLGQCLSALERFAEAHEHLRDAGQYFRATGQRFALAIVLVTKVVSLDGLSRTAEATEVAREALKYARALQNVPLQGMAHHQFDMLLYSRGDYSAASSQPESALVMRRRTGERSNEAKTLCQLGLAYYEMGEYVRASIALLTSRAIFIELRDITARSRWTSRWRTAASCSGEMKTGLTSAAINETLVLALVPFVAPTCEERHG
ncbi:tetratricopeptide repeat protein [Amycolatopsis alkalitolerans]|uniref:Tetratricopeptide repeat protein n=1 Tax=Amycolatopsis alkalitolerans TaxID=2547244 RepID=A0A5C4M3C3_9PSEU|nr:tetratricopeptide repeat protein [Amycolatopsis alkalitolerans]TNC26393.1 tetratricopeptide repeat protein [Amycolatopsis alkalitolerans]